MKREEMRREIRLCLRDDVRLLPAVLAVIEKSALSFGLGESGALALTLAGEEIFNYLCATVRPQAEIEICCRDGGYRTILDFSLPLREFSLKSFNLTASVNLEDEQSLEEMGLVIASRMVDSLELVASSPGRLRLILSKEKSYPEAGGSGSAATGFGPEFTVVVPDDEELKYFLEALNRSLAPGRLAPELRYPGKLIDMIRCGERQAALVRDRRQRFGGGIIWFWSSDRMVECQGPLLLPGGEAGERRRRAAALLDRCLHAIARTAAVGLVCRSFDPELAGEYFEPLGSLYDCGAAGAARELRAGFRQLREDPGAVIWCHPALQGELKERCRRLALPREIRTIGDSGETREEFSVLASDFDRSRSLVTLRPLWAGADLAENLARHLALFAAEGIPNILFRLDLGQSWMAALAPALLSNGFTPRLLLPYGGRQGDLLIFQKLDGVQ
jgi:hypothetical protein